MGLNMQNGAGVAVTNAMKDITPLQGVLISSPGKGIELAELHNQEAEEKKRALTELTELTEIANWNGNTYLAEHFKEAAETQLRPIERKFQGKRLAWVLSKLQVKLYSQEKVEERQHIARNALLGSVWYGLVVKLYERLTGMWKYVQVREDKYDKQSPGDTCYANAYPLPIVKTIDAIRARLPETTVEIVYLVAKEQELPAAHFLRVSHGDQTFYIAAWDRPLVNEPLIK